MAYETQPWTFAAPDNLVDSIITDAPNASVTTAQGAGKTNGKEIVNYATASVMGALALLWLFGGVLMKDARL